MTMEVLNNYRSRDALADLHAVDESFEDARKDREDQRRYLAGEITYRSWVDGMKRRAKAKRNRNG